MSAYNQVTSNEEIVTDGESSKNLVLSENTIELDGKDSDTHSKVMGIKEVLQYIVLKLYRFCNENYFMVCAVIAILIALAAPSIGAKGGPIKSEYTIFFGVTCIVFLISGLALKSEVLVNAFVNMKLNTCIQCIVFGVMPLLFWMISLPLRLTPLNSDLLDGYVILGCLPMTVNLCYVLTSSSKGNESGALINATFGNIVGIFITPLLILGYLGRSSSVSYSDVLLRLVYKVIIPLIVGQILLNLAPYNETWKSILAAVKPWYKRIQESCLALIFWASFCNTFKSDISLPPLQVFIVIVLVIPTELLAYTFCWGFYSIPCMHFSLPDKITGFFCSSHKTLALGLPLITTMFEGSDEVGLYTIPLLVYHPSLIFFGGIFSPMFSRMIEAEEATRDRTRSKKSVVDLEMEGYISPSSGGNEI